MTNNPSYSPVILLLGLQFGKGPGTGYGPESQRNAGHENTAAAAAVTDADVTMQFVIETVDFGK